MASNSITYKPLQFQDEIRLLVLQPAGNHYDQTTDEQIKHVRLSDKPQYKALSYVWDQATGSGSGDLSNGHTFTNLELALKYFRRHIHLEEPVDECMIWIDALCINQQDTKERNHQVAQMGLIYSQAKSVNIWLGCGDSATRSAINMLSMQTDVAYVYQRPFDASSWTTLPNLIGFRALCAQKYWTRLWIIQEVLLAADIEIHYGDIYCQWSQLCWFLGSIDIDWLSKSDNGDNTFQEKVTIIEEIRSSTAARLANDWVDRKVKMIRTFDADPVSGPLITLCSKYGSANCKDPRDKIFGLHSLAESCCRAGVSVDYALSLPAIYHQVLKHSLERHCRSDNAISISQKFHEKLRISNSQCTKAADGERSDIVTDALGYKTSTILYVSPPGFEQESRNWHKDKPRPLPLPLNCRKQLMKISDLHKMHGTAKFRSQCMSRDYDLAVAFERNMGWSDVFGPVPGERKKAWPSSTSSNRAYARVRESYKDGEALNRILFHARSVTSGCGNPANETSIALCESGFICFVPSVAIPGDLIFQFPQSSVSVIISAGEDRLIGRAVNFLSDSPGKPFTLSGGTMNWQALRNYGMEITLSLHLPTLQAMTASSRSANLTDDFDVIG